MTDENKQVEHVAWTSIESLHNVRKAVMKYPHLLAGYDNVVRYQAKVKLHGTNAGIRIDPDGTVTAMSRSVCLTPESDNAGFAKWVEPRKQQFAKLASPNTSVIIYGEWAGPGIQKGVALNALSERIFAVFAARLPGFTLNLLTDPEGLRVLVDGIEGCYVLPWFNSGEKFEIDLTAPGENIQDVLDRINAHVEAVETCDPWCSALFGVRGVGEGLVFYPIDPKEMPADPYTTFSNLCFKAKGEQHKVISKSKPVQADPSVAENVTNFAKMVVTPARIEQGVRQVNGGEFVYDTKQLGEFMKWLNADILKETKDEIEASGLDEKQALRACMELARKQFLYEAGRT